MQAEVGWSWRWQYVCEHTGIVMALYEPRARICLEISEQHFYKDNPDVTRAEIRDERLAAENVEVMRYDAAMFREDGFAVLYDLARRYQQRTKEGAQRRTRQQINTHELEAIAIHNQKPKERINLANPFRRKPMT